MLKLLVQGFLIGSGILGILMIPSPSYGCGSKLETLEETAVTQSPINNGSPEQINQDHSENNSLTVSVDSANHNTSRDEFVLIFDTEFTGQDSLTTRLNISCGASFPPNI